MVKPEVYFRNNTASTLSLLEAMLSSGPRRLVFSSTAAVYGEPESVPIPEGARLQPTNAYGESKLLVEHMLRWMNQVHGLRYASLRYFNVAGAPEGPQGIARGEAHEPESHLIPLILDVALGRRQSIRIYGDDYPTPDGTCIRDYIHVSDLAEAHLLALDALESHSRLIFNHVNSEMYLERLGAIPLLTFSATPDDEVRLFLKRFIDVVCASLAILILSPLFLLIALIVRLNSPGPAIFSQTRCGLNGRPLHVLQISLHGSGCRSPPLRSPPHESTHHRH